MNDVTSTIGHDRLARLMKRGTDFLGCEVAVLGGAMSWISSAGGLGSVQRRPSE